MKDMIILISYFNFTDSQNIKNNILSVKNNLEKTEIPFMIGEVYLENPFFKQESNIFSFQTNSYMFYKENIINILLDKVNKDYEYVCVMDGDIYFENDNWYEKIIENLKKNNICQPFIEAYWLDRNGNKYKKQKSILIDSEGHTGFIWAFRTEWLKKYKLLDLAVIGGGDRVLSDVILNKKESKQYLQCSYQEYQENIKDLTYGICDLIVIHMYHGNIYFRQYFERENIIINILNKYELKDVKDLLYKNKDGLYLWKEIYRAELNEEILKYFKNRRDDL